MITTDSRRLWHAWRSRADQSAFADLVRPEIRYAADLARRAGAGPAEAEDAVQDALVKLANEPSDAPVEVGVRAWICRRVVLGVKMHIRSSVRRRRHERSVPHERRTDEPGAQLERRDQVEVALESVDEKERRAIVLRFLHDLEYREMAYILGISENACRIRVHRALKHLRRRLGERAAAMVAMLVVPPVATEGSLIGLAAGTLGTAAGATAASTAAASTAAVGTKTVVATGTGLLAAAAITVGVVVGRKEEAPQPEPPPVVVAEAPVAAPVSSVPVPSAPPPVPMAPPPAPVRTTPPAVALLDAHFSGTKDASGSLEDFDTARRVIGSPLGRTVRVKTTGPVTDVDLDRLAERYDRIVLDRGVFHVKRGVRVFDRGVLEIVGQGRDETFLLSPVEAVASVRKEGHFAGLIVKDLTLDGDLPDDGHGGRMFGCQGKGAAVFERVRFRSWGTGGYGAAVGCSGSALLAFRDCLFVGAYKRKPTGWALAMRRAALYLFDRCRFSDLECVVTNTIQFSQHPRSIGRFEDCIFDNSHLVRRQGSGPTRRAPYALHVSGGRVLLGWGHDTPQERREQWRAAAATSIEDVAWEDEPARCTVKDLRQVLEAYDPPVGRRVVAVYAYTWFGCEDPTYAIYLHDADDACEVDLVHLLDGRITTKASRGGFALNKKVYFHAGGRTTLRKMVVDRWERLDPLRPVGGVELRRDTAHTPMLYVVDRRRDALQWLR